MNENKELEQALKDGDIGSGGPKQPPEKVPAVYKKVGQSKIPVSKVIGKVWQSRKDQAIQKRKTNGSEAAWDEAVRYYKNDQSNHRDDTDGDTAGNDSVAQRMNKTHSETENVVFSNTNAMVPALYAKNPQAEFTATSDDEEAGVKARQIEMLVNTLAARKTVPGFNLKPKAKRSVVMTTLTNQGWLEIGYTKKEESSEAAFDNLIEITGRLEKAKDSKEVVAIEGELIALEEKINLLRSSGPFVKARNPKQIIKDPNAEEPDGSDGNFMMVSDYLDTAYIQAVYASYDPDAQDGKGEYKSIYKSSHVIRLNNERSVDDEVNSFTLIDNAATHKNFGYDDEESYRKAQKTKVWYVWDKVTRRVLLFNDKDWSWPIWVWDDPYKLDRFFPFYMLEFYTDPEGEEGRGEVSYYLDQQDAINEINDEERRARKWVKRNIMYNSNVINKTDVENYLSGDDGTAVGINLPPETKLGDYIFSAPPPSLQYGQLFDVERKFRAIDRISSTTEVSRGGEYKTNTTNQAINKYEQTATVRLDEKVDAIEDWLGSVLWGVAQLCLQFMSKEEVVGVLGETYSDGWEQLEPREIRQKYSVSVVGGSTAKPTSRAKKQEALEVGQILGQFASASPAAILVSLKLFQKSFDEINIKDEDWAMIKDTMMQQLQRGGEGQGGGQPGESGDGGAGGSDAKAALEQVAQIVDQLPPQAKEALGKALARDVPIVEALPRIIEMIQSQQGEQQ